MMRRSRELEKQMLRSEAQSRTLRRRLDEARHTADHDHLTGLPNRRAFETLFEEQYRQARAAMEPLCVAFCDIDHFKAINDGHGHEAGDRVLKLVAECLAHLSNDRCHVARHGGEEFVLLLRGDTQAEAVAKLDLLREQLAARRLVNRATDEPFGQVTFSAGVADVFACGDPRTALRAADGALYRAKNSGRNRVEPAVDADCRPPHAAAA
jgi:diguanylate cyclase